MSALASVVHWDCETLILNLGGVVRGGGAGMCPFEQLPWRLGRQSVHNLPDLCQTQFLQRPLPLHRQHSSMMKSQISQRLQYRGDSLGIRSAHFAVQSHKPIVPDTALTEPAIFVCKYNCTYIYLYCTHICHSGLLWKRLFQRRGVSCYFWVTSQAWVNMVHNIFPESAPSVAVLAPPSSSMAAVSKALIHC